MGLIDDLRASIAEHNRQIKANKEKISRLNKVKTVLSDSKDTIDTYKTNWKNNVVTPFSEDFSWYGTNKNSEVECAETSVVDAYSTYYNNIDETLDAICDKITELENENHRRYGAIGELESRINSLVNAIEKMIN